MLRAARPSSASSSTWSTTAGTTIRCSRWSAIAVEVSNSNSGTVMEDCRTRWLCSRSLERWSQRSGRVVHLNLALHGTVASAMAVPVEPGTLIRQRPGSEALDSLVYEDGAYERVQSVLRWRPTSSIRPRPCVATASPVCCLLTTSVVAPLQAERRRGDTCMRCIRQAFHSLAAV